jgi:hypothetical protein
MKNVTTILACLFFCVLVNTGKAKDQFSSGIISLDGANDTLTVTFKVNGNAACESGIEATLVGKTGILSANWDAGTKMITVKYLSAQVQKSDLYSYLALAGYDNAELRAKQPAYDALSTDCKYTRDPETE